MSLLPRAYLVYVRRIWADYFDSQGLHYAFYSATDATGRQEALQKALAVGELTTAIDEAVEGNQRIALPGEDEEADEEDTLNADMGSSTPSDGSYDSTESEISDERVDLDSDEDLHGNEDPRSKVLSVLELEDLFIASAPDLSGGFPLVVGCAVRHLKHDCVEFTDPSGNRPEKLVVGLVGYPNVGKSSTINSLLGEKKVSVSSTPGKTKHFQTINLSDKITLCDCPGLVFPQFATTKADLVCDGVLPIDQLREHTGPVTLVVRRIPKAVLEGMYGLNIKSLGPEEGGNGSLCAEDLLIPYAGRSLLIRSTKKILTIWTVARGFTRSGQGNPDEARAARYILKDYVNAKLLFCHPPPNHSADDFNFGARKLALKRIAGKKRAPSTRVGKNANTYIFDGSIDHPSDLPPLPGQSEKSRSLDRHFFDESAGLAARPFAKDAMGRIQNVSRPMLYPHHLSVADDGTPLTTQGVQVGALGGRLTGKKHHKKMKRTKQRSGKGYD